MNPNRISKFGVILALALVAILVSTVPATAQAERIYYTGTECPFFVSAPEREWVSEDFVLHQRGIHSINTSTTSTAYITGTSYLVWNTDIDLTTGAVHAYGKVEIHPDAYDGIWVGSFSTHVSPEGVLNGSGTLHGTGELEGMIDFNRMSSPEYYDPLCSNINSNDTGSILIP